MTSANESGQQHPLNALLYIQSKEGLQSILQITFRCRHLFHTAFQDDEEVSYTPSELYRREKKDQKYLKSSDKGGNGEKHAVGALSSTDRMLIEEAVNRAADHFEEKPSVNQTIQLLEEIAKVIRTLLVQSATLQSAEDIQKLLPEGVDERLQELLTKQLGKKVRTMEISE
eukprot:gb/GECG01006719.1/.p1 GENE.gb/GECG01006719.1/~~gb/GECG01006719.1/.p1  ORF type:complete len:171 (+),score=34.50 gb/GECG01006719.1/:1-513(+)